MIVRNVLVSLIFSASVTVSFGSVANRGGDNIKNAPLRCEFYDAKCAQENSKDGISSDCQGERECEDDNNVCFAVWSNSTQGVNSTVGHKSGRNVKLMGCMKSSEECSEKDICLQDDPQTKSGHVVCCCSGNLCNAKFEWVPKAISNESSPDDDNESQSKTSESRSILTVVYFIVSLIVLAFATCVCWYVFRQRKAFRALPTNANEACDGDVAANGDFGATLAVQLPQDTPIELLEIKARGRFGAVWRGRMGLTDVAVKIFPLQDKNSWAAEKEIYNLARMSDHPNVLQFLGVDRRGENLQQEYWLATEFHELGSLCDFLKSNVVSWDDLCKIALSIAKGLTFLHEEIPADSKSGMKPALAHRDFKSKNVLIKTNMTACIADFGLALVFEPGKSCGDTHGQVGTRRYMAPEVLEGAINFSRDAFLRIDMYACGLVLWELASRCTLGQTTSPNSNTVNGSMAEEYKLPFEAEANNPSLEQLQELVVNQKVRPRLKDSWRLQAGFGLLCDTITECWDHDAEARLSASCVVERLGDMRHMGYNNNVTPDVVIVNNNMNNVDSGMGSTYGDTDSLESSATRSNATEMTPLFIQP